MSERPVTPITPGRFVWHELNTQDVGRSAAFYGELFGWKIDASDPAYIHVHAGTQTVAGMVKAASPAAPAHWLCYVSTADVDATVARAAAVGCRVLAAPFAIEPGRLAVLADPHGAVFGVWCAAHGDPLEVTKPALGSFPWDQLNTPDPDASFAFYSHVFGWTRASSGAGAPMSTLMRGERAACSLMQAPAGVDAHWLSYVLVEDLAATRERAKRLGGKVMVERSAVPTGGAFSVLQDDQGAIFAAVAFGA
jgi:predicted enzyme related to lactoylglutathione lyase